jgi:hypothetical protein
MDDNLNGALLAVKSAFEAVQLAFGELGASDFLTSFLRGLADALRTVAANAEQVARFALGALLIPALFAASSAFTALSAAIIANPLGLLLTTISVAVGLLAAFKDELFLTTDGVTTLGDVASGIGGAISDVFSGLADLIAGVVNPAIEQMEGSFGGVGNVAVEVLRTIARGFDLILTPIKVITTSMVVLFDNSFGAVAELGVDAVNVIIEAFNSLARFVSRTIRAILAESNKLAAQVGGAFGFEGVDLGVGDFAIPEFQTIANEFEGSGQKLGDALKAGFDKAVNDNTFEQSLENALETVEGSDLFANISDRIALAREERLAAQSNRDILQEQATAARTPTVPTVDTPVSAVGAEAGNKALSEGNDLLSRKAEILGVLKEEEAQGILNKTALNELLAEGNITQAQFNELVKELGVNSTETESLLGGLKDSFMELDTSVRTLGASFGDAFVGAIGRASAALADFALTGARNFDQLREQLANLLQNLGKQILQVIIQTLILKAIQSTITGFSGGGAAALSLGTLAGGIGGSAANIGASQRQAGGPVGRDEAFLVGERGPEIFRPTRRGNIDPVMPSASPEVNVQIVNVQSQEEIVSVLDQPEAQEKILNTVRTNGGALR